MFLHGDVVHLLINLVFLWIFAGNIEERMGRLRFSIFYVVCGLVAAYLQYDFNPSSTLPMVGASGAIAGILGAFFCYTLMPELNFGCHCFFYLSSLKSQRSHF
jgi:Uncharacterized membrane protein (homolog of Drosophila rhomboid)